MTKYVMNKLEGAVQLMRFNQNTTTTTTSSPKIITATITTTIAVLHKDQAMHTHIAVDVQLRSFLTSTLLELQPSSPCPAAVLLVDVPPVLIVRDDKWTPEPI